MPFPGRFFRHILPAILVLVLLGQHSSPFAHGQAAQKPSAAGLTVSPSSGPTGTLVTLTAPAGSLPPNTVAGISFQDATNGYLGFLIAKGPVNGDGSLSLQVSIPPQAAAGGARIFAMSAGVAISAGFTVQPSISLSPSSAPPGSAVLVTGSGFAPNGTTVYTITAGLTSTVVLQPLGVLGNEPVISNLFGTFIGSLIVPGHIPLGSALITASDGTYTASAPFTLTTTFVTPTTTSTPAPTGTATQTPSPTSTPTSGAVPTAAYFAEGYTGQAATNGRATFGESLNILNPSTTPAPVTITYYIQGNIAPTTVSRTVAPGTVLRESVNTDIGPDRVVAAVVTSPQHVFVTRTITRISASGTRLDSSTTAPAAAPALRWDFPEGYTGSTFQEYLTALNPSTITANVTVLLAPQAASAAGARTLHLLVPPGSRVTANIRALNEGNSAKSVGMVVSSDQPIVAERVEYFGDGSGSGKFGSTVSSGITTPASQLHLAPVLSSGVTASAGGSSQAAGDQAFITILNPQLSGGPLPVTASFADSAGQPFGHPVSVSVAAGTRQTIAVNTALGAQPGGPLTVTLSAAAPIDAELAQYFGGSPNIGAHPGVAFPALANTPTAVEMPDLSTTLEDNTPISRDLWLYNPGSAAITVTASYFGSSGAPVQATYTVPAGGLQQVSVNLAVGSRLPAGPLGAELRLASGSGGFLAYAIGRTADGLSATEGIGIPAS